MYKVLLILNILFLGFLGTIFSSYTMDNNSEDEKNLILAFEQHHVLANGFYEQFVKHQQYDGNKNELYALVLAKSEVEENHGLLNISLGYRDSDPLYDFNYCKAKISLKNPVFNKSIKHNSIVAERLQELSCFVQLFISLNETNKIPHLRQQRVLFLKITLDSKFSPDHLLVRDFLGRKFVFNFDQTNKIRNIPEGQRSNIFKALIAEK